MKPLIAWPPLSADVVDALQRLETATEFTGLRGAYDLVQSEANRRAFPALFAMMPGMALYVLLYGVPQWLGWFRLPEILFNIGWVLIVPFTAILTNALRGVQAIRDEMRIGHALQKWQDKARKAAA